MQLYLSLTPVSILTQQSNHEHTDKDSIQTTGTQTRQLQCIIICYFYSLPTQPTHDEISWKKQTNCQPEEKSQAINTQHGVLK